MLVYGAGKLTMFPQCCQGLAIRDSYAGQRETKPGKNLGVGQTTGHRRQHLSRNDPPAHLRGRAGGHMNQAAVKIMDVDRAGGAWWSKIAPSIKKEILRNVGQCFVNCETATADTPAAARAAVPEASFVDSGGIRNGLEMAKAIALGADYVEWHSLFENERYNQNGNIPRVLYSSVSKIGNLYFINYFTPYASLTKAFISGVKLIISFTRR